MARSMVYDVDVVVPAAEMYRLFTTADYWHDLVEVYHANGTQAEITHFSSDESGTDITLSHIASSQDLPSITHRFVPKSFTISRVQHFDPFDPTTNQATGHYRAEVPAPVDVTGEYLLSDADHGSRMRLNSSCRVRIPILGRQIEPMLLGGLKALFVNEGAFTAEWVASHQ